MNIQRGMHVLTMGESKIFKLRDIFVLFKQERIILEYIYMLKGKKK